MCLTLCNPMEYRPSGPSVHEISKSRMLEYIAIFFSRGSSPPRDRTHASWCSCISRRILNHWTTQNKFQCLARRVDMRSGRRHILFGDLEPAAKPSSSCRGCNQPELIHGHLQTFWASSLGIQGFLGATWSFCDQASLVELPRLEQPISCSLWWLVYVCGIRLWWRLSL